MDDPGWNGKEGGLPKERLDDFDDRNGATGVSYVDLGAVGGNGHRGGTDTDGNSCTHGVSGGVDDRNVVMGGSYVDLGAVGGNGCAHGVSGGRLAPRPSVNLS